MPNPFSHIVYADKVLQGRLNDRKIDEREYFVGATFPDIRYFLKLKKNDTHTNIEDNRFFWDKITKEKDSFEMGIWVHIYVDRKWDKYWLEYFNSTDLFSKYYYPVLTLADQVLFDDFDRKYKIKSYFSQVQFKELGRYSATEEIIKKWHKLIREDLMVKNNYALALKYANLFGRDKNFVDEMFFNADALKEDKAVVNRVRGFEGILWV